jgi:hypothetical protein
MTPYFDGMKDDINKTMKQLKKNQETIGVHKDTDLTHI